MNSSKIKYHGITSILLIVVSFSIGCVELYRHSLLLLFTELAFTVFALVFIGKGYCAKCECRENCNHILFGKVSLLLSKYNEGPYTITDWVTVSLPIIVVIAFPQFWLYKNQTMMILYWIFFSIGAIDAVIFGCAKCMNKRCAMCRNKC